MIGKKKNEDFSAKASAPTAEKLTIVAAGTVVQGAMSVEGDFRLDGYIEGNITCKGKMVIGPQGHIKGNVSSTGIVLHGIVEGDVHTSEEFVLKSGSVMRGDIYTSKLEIEPKAKFNGVCNTSDKEPVIGELPINSKNNQNHKEKAVQVSA